MTMPLTSSWKKKPIRCESAPLPGRPVARRPPAGAPRRLSQCDQLGTRLYLPDESILKRKNLPCALSPCESKLIGCPRIEVGSFVFLIAASTLARLGVCPALQTDAIASSITCVAANTGGPNVPNAPNFALAAWAIAESAAIAVMSGPNEDTYEPAIVNVPGENSPSVPKITAFLCCCARFRPNCWAFAATCHGRTITEVAGVTLATSEEKSVSFCETDSWSTLIPAAWKTGVIALTSPVE